MANLDLAGCILIAGATATGKSAVAMELAGMLGGEIISVDSMQVYRGMDIGTAKPSPEERQRVPHHLIDVVDLSEEFDAARFLVSAAALLQGIRSRGKVPIFCGGTGLYFKALLAGIGYAPPADTALRAELEATPMPALLTELAEKDPETYARIDRQNPRRVLRALAVIRLTGRPYSAQRAEWTRAEAGTNGARVAVGLVRTMEDLRQRIDVRVDAMFRHGLVEETGALLARGLAANRTAMQALGYAQVAEYLQGVRGLPETIERVKVRTRQYAKRQMTWFRGQLPLEWVELPPNSDLRQVAEELARRC